MPHCIPIEVPECCNLCDDDTPTPGQWATAVETAWQILADKVSLPVEWTGRRCLYVWRPCAVETCCGRCMPAVCECDDPCAPTTAVRVPLPNLAPDDIAAIVSGSDVATGRSWRTARALTVSVAALLDVDLDGGLPTAQNLDRSIGRDDTWGLAVWVGTTPPVVVDAVGSLACQVWTACDPDDTNQIPGNAVSVREGETTVTLDPDTEPIQAVREAVALVTGQASTFGFCDPNSTDPAPGVWEPATEAIFDAVTA